MKAIRQKQLRLLGHTIREQIIEKLTMEGKVEVRELGEDRELMLLELGCYG